MFHATVATAAVAAPARESRAGAFWLIIIAGILVILVAKSVWFAEKCPRCKGTEFKWDLHALSGRVSRKRGNSRRCISCGCVMETKPGIRRRSRNKSRSIDAAHRHSTNIDPVGSKDETRSACLTILSKIGVQNVSGADTPGAPASQAAGDEPGRALARGEPHPPGTDLRQSPTDDSRNRILKIQGVAESYRASVPATSIEWKHRKMQADLFEYLALCLPAECDIRLECGGIDILVVYRGRATIIEVKTDSDASRCIRTGIGQCLEYSSRRNNGVLVGTDSLVVFGPSWATGEAESTREYLRSALNVRFEYFGLGQEDRLAHLVRSVAEGHMPR